MEWLYRILYEINTHISVSNMLNQLKEMTHKSNNYNEVKFIIWMFYRSMSHRKQKYSKYVEIADPEGEEHRSKIEGGDVL